MKKISVIGLGYIGLPTLIAIAKSKKFEAVGFDIDNNKIKEIKNNTSPIEDQFVKSNIRKVKYQVSSNPIILKDSDVFIICVPTPVYKDYTPDYSYIINAVKIIIKYLKKGSHVVLESTVNPGTCEEIIQPLIQNNTKFTVGKDINLAHCPERINPGDDQWNILNINRNIGSINQEMNHQIAAIYQSFITQAKINTVSCLKIAEATKIVENTFRDINIAYVNELAKSFDSMNINLIETIHASSNKPFGFLPHYPGAGVGGHCIAVDPYYLINRAAQSGFDHKFLKLAREINNSMPKYTIDLLIKQLNKIKLPVNGTKIALLGMSYKPNVGDLRESPSLDIKKRLLELGADLSCHDPYIKQFEQKLKKVLTKQTAVIISTAHDLYKEQLVSFINNNKSIKVVIDGRNCINIKKLRKKLIYKGIGIS